MKNTKHLLLGFVLVVLLLGVTPLVFAEGAGTDGGITIDIGEPENTCPEIYQDFTQRSWEPNDQTWYTATTYGTPGTPDTNCYGDLAYEVEERGNYVFAGETLTYYVVVEDEDGDDDIESVRIDGFGACMEIDPSIKFDSSCGTWDSYAMAKFSFGVYPAACCDNLNNLTSL